MARLRIVGPVGFALLAVGCQSPASNQSAISAFGQGVAALQGATDTLSKALANQTISKQSAVWRRARTPLTVSEGCGEIPTAIQPAEKLPPCAVVSRSQTGDAAVDANQASLRQSKVYLGLVQKYARALGALAVSGDPATAAKNTQAIGQSIAGVAQAVGNKYAHQKADAIAAAGLGQGLMVVGGALLADWQYHLVKRAVETANEPISQIADLLVASFQNAQNALLQAANDEIDVHSLHIMDVGWKKPISESDYTKQLARLTAAVDRINLIRSSGMIGAVQRLGAAHAALNDALQRKAGLAATPVAMTGFLTACRKAQSILQRIAELPNSPSF